jgi:pimeloyl-ACP methyl ester carboxylesterase
MFCSLIFVAGLSLSSNASAQKPYQVVGETTERIGNFKRTLTTVQNGSLSINRFVLHRIVKAGLPASKLKGAIVLVPGLGASGSLFEFGDAAGGGDFEHSLAAYLASRNIDVYLYSPRVSLVTATTCETQPCSEAATWGISTILDDLGYARRLIKRVHSDHRPAIGGLSWGAMVSLAAVNRDPKAWAGVAPWEGTIFLSDPALVQAYGQACAGMTATLESGYVLDSNAIYKLFLDLATNAPNDASPLIPGLTNRQALVAAFSSPSAGPPGSIFPAGAIFVAGNVGAGTFDTASDARLSSLLNRFNPFEAMAAYRDYVCILASQVDATSKLGAYRRPVLLIGAGQAWGPYMGDIAGLVASNDIEEVMIPNGGHLDQLLSPQHESLVDGPLARWLDDVFDR